jgi:hypothetical protein
MDKTELLEISEQIKSLEGKRKALIVSVMKGVRKPITEWAANVSLNVTVPEILSMLIVVTD